LDDLECSGLKIIQDKRGYTFTMDAVLLANFVKAKPSDRIVDIGTGSGVIAILLSGKTQAKEIVGIELQERLYNMASRSVLLNNIGNRVKLINCDMRIAHLETGTGVFDVAVMNPPYMPYEGNVEDAKEIDICRREVSITLKESLESAARLLKFGGILYIILKGERLADLICAMRSSGIEPKKITPIQPAPHKNIDTIIVEGKKDGKSGMIFNKQLTILDEDGNYKEEARRFYNK